MSCSVVQRNAYRGIGLLDYAYQRLMCIIGIRFKVFGYASVCALYHWDIGRVAGHVDDWFLNLERANDKAKGFSRTIWQGMCWQSASSNDCFSWHR